MASISKDELLRLARTGALARVKELEAELESIYGTFPDLRRRSGSGRPAKSSAAGNGGATARSWTAADRRAVSERMKKYWALRRAKAAKAGKPAK